jgi:arylsulfatase A-like enzyme
MDGRPQQLSGRPPLCGTLRSPKIRTSRVGRHHHPNMTLPSGATADARPAESEYVWSAIGTALCFTSAGGLIEVVILAIEKRADPLLRLSRDFVWMAPTGLLMATAAATMPCVLLAMIWHRRFSRALVLFVPFSLVYLDLLMLVPRLSHYAAALVAAGLGVQTVRLISGHPDAARRLARRSVPILVTSFSAVTVWAWITSGPTHGRLPGALAAPAASPNVLLITLDTVRAANLSMYGYVRRTTPKLGEFASRGVVFENAFATAPWTLPSHASLFTGRWPHQLSADYESPLDARYPTIAEFLAGHGYRTGGFAANLGYCSLQSGLGRGFEHYEDYPRSIGQIASSSTLVRKVADNFTLRRIVKNDQHLNRVDAASLNGRVLRWLGSRRDSAPFFIFVNYFDAHEPYLPPEPFDRQFNAATREGRYSPIHHWLWNTSVEHRPLTADEIREEVDAYDGTLAYLDQQVGELLDALAQLDLLDDTVVMITSDHGEEFGEHGVFDHGYTLYRQALQVPLLMVAPGRIPSGRRVTTPVTLRDVAATIVEITGLGAVGAFPGTSLTGLWNPDIASSGQPPLLSEVSRVSGQPAWFPASKGDMKAVFQGGFHYILNGDGVEELYNLAEDPNEQADLAKVPQHRDRLLANRAVVANLSAIPVK